MQYELACPWHSLLNPGAQAELEHALVSTARLGDALDHIEDSGAGDVEFDIRRSLLVGNKSFTQLGYIVNAILREGCTASNDTVNTFRKISTLAKTSDKRYVAQCHFGHPEYMPPLNASTA